MRSLIALSLVVVGLFGYGIYDGYIARQLGPEAQKELGLEYDIVTEEWTPSVVGKASGGRRPGKRNKHFFVLSGQNKSEFVVTRIIVSLTIRAAESTKSASSMQHECPATGELRVPPGLGLDSRFEICGFPLSDSLDEMVTAHTPRPVPRSKESGTLAIFEDVENRLPMETRLRGIDVSWSADVFGHRRPIKLIAIPIDYVLSTLSAVMTLFDRVDSY